MEENCQYGIWKSSLPFYSIPSHTDGKELIPLKKLEKRDSRDGKGKYDVVMYVTGCSSSLWNVQSVQMHRAPHFWGLPIRPIARRKNLIVKNYSKL